MYPRNAWKLITNNSQRRKCDACIHLEVSDYSKLQSDATFTPVHHTLLKPLYDMV